jgi:hypothetical protein
VNVGDSVKHSLDHWDRQEWDPAMLHACNAVDGTGKKRYPELPVGARFKRTIRDSLDIFRLMAAAGIDFENTRFPIAVKSDLPDRRPDVADIMYGIHRCSHGHGEELPEGFELTAHAPGMVRIRISREGKIQLPASAALGLLAIAVFAPENKGQVIPGVYSLSWYQHVFHICGWWGRQDHFREIISVDQSPRVTLEFSEWWNDWTPV